MSEPLQPSSPTSPPPEPISERRVYRADGGSGREEPGDAAKTPLRGRTRDARRSRMLAVIVLVLVAIVIALAGVAAGSSAFNGSQDDLGTFKLLPITTTTS
jgi:hypothetical protein